MAKIHEYYQIFWLPDSPYGSGLWRPVDAHTFKSPEVPLRLFEESQQYRLFPNCQVVKVELHSLN